MAMLTYTTKVLGYTYGVRACFEEPDAPVEFLDADSEWVATGHVVRDFDRNWQNALKWEILGGEPANAADMAKIDKAISHAFCNEQPAMKSLEKSAYMDIYLVGNQYVAIAKDKFSDGCGFYQISEGDVVDMYDGTVCEFKDDELIRRKKQFFGMYGVSTVEEMVSFENFDFGNGSETLESITEKLAYPK